MPPTPRDILILQSIPGVGPHRLRGLLHRFPSADLVAHASVDQLVGTDGIDRKTAARMASFVQGREFALRCRAADATLLRLAHCGDIGVTFWDSAYPSLLRVIYDPPLLLFVRGSLAEIEEPAIAVVGTRSATPYGTLLAERLAAGLAAHRITVVSGLARGIDTSAHRAALAEGGRTVAVIGSGLDRIYPRENTPLSARIARTGAVISEYAPGTPPNAMHFPRRNRIISGLTLGTIVVETGIKGGAMITAGIALNQNREVFALPAPVDPTRPAGTNRLIREGRALLVESVEDVLEEFAPDFHGRTVCATMKSSGAPPILLHPGAAPSGT
jgi:DNA processing protein